MNKLATILLCVNFITVLFPQPGYIHPDEFFQSTEIVAGDVLKVSHFRAWEFNSSFPVRSIVFPYLLTSPSLYLLRWMNSTGYAGLQISAVKVVMATRLPLAFLSVFGYLATGRLADCFCADKYLSTILYCSSYVTWIYYTRTFSNSIEAILLAIVLLLSLSNSRVIINEPRTPASENKVVKDISRRNDNKSEDDTQDDAVKEDMDPKHKSKGGVKERSRNTDLCDESEIKTSSQNALHTDKKRSDFSGKPKRDQDFETVISFVLGLVTMAGFFNRPTFLVFAFTPVLLWLWNVRKGCGKSNRIGALLMCMAFMFVGSLISFISFVLLDTVYYNPELFRKTSTISEYVFTLSHMEISEKGLELLKNVLLAVSLDLQNLASSAIVTPWNFINYNMEPKNLADHGLHPRFTHCLVNLPLLTGPLYVPFLIVSALSVYKLLAKSKLDSPYNNSVWLTLMALVPILSLSIFPHQEPRFLIPALPVFMVMGAKIVSELKPGKLSFLAIWTFFNIMLTLIYGYVHQAALIPALSIYQQKLSASMYGHAFGHHHAFFYKTYPPPRHLLLTAPSDTQLSIYDFAGAPANSLIEKVNLIKSKCHEANDKCSFYVFLPSTVAPKVLDKLSNSRVSTTSICPHLSLEAPPRLKAWWQAQITFDEFVMDLCLNILKIT